MKNLILIFVLLSSSLIAQRYTPVFDVEPLPRPDYIPLLWEDGYKRHVITYHTECKSYGYIDTRGEFHPYIMPTDSLLCNHVEQEQVQEQAQPLPESQEHEFDGVFLFIIILLIVGLITIVIIALFP